MAELVVSLVVRAPQERVWQHLVDWPTHGSWMLLTHVVSLSPDDEPAGPGARIEGVTGVGPLAMRDPMTVTQWQPPPAQPARCAVAHTGPVVRGAGAFEVETCEGGSRITWSEWVTLPLGLLGEIGWLAVRPVVRLGLLVSLRRLARLVEAG